MHTTDQLRQVRGKQKENETAIEIRKMSDDAAYAEAVRIRESLSAELKKYEDQKKSMREFPRRYPEKARAYFSRDLPLWSLTAGEIEVLARTMIVTGKVPSVSEAAPLAAKYSDPESRDAIAQFDSLRRAIAILELAVSIQRKAEIGERIKASREIAKYIQPKCELVNRRLANAFLDFAQVLSEWGEFSGQLFSLDEDVIDSLKPRPRRLGILADMAVQAWVNEAVEAGLIDREDPRLAFLRGGVSAASAA